MLDWSEHFERMIRLKIEFDLAEKALQDWSGNPEMIGKHAQEDLASLRELISKGLAERSMRNRIGYLILNLWPLTWNQHKKKQQSERRHSRIGCHSTSSFFRWRSLKAF